MDWGVRKRWGLNRPICVAKLVAYSMSQRMHLQWALRRFVGEAAVPLLLVLGEKFNRHGVSSKERFSRQPRAAAETS